MFLFINLAKKLNFLDSKMDTLTSVRDEIYLLKMLQRKRGDFIKFSESDQDQDTLINLDSSGFGTTLLLSPKIFLKSCFDFKISL